MKNYKRKKKKQRQTPREIPKEFGPDQLECPYCNTFGEIILSGLQDVSFRITALSHDGVIEADEFIGHGDYYSDHHWIHMCQECGEEVSLVDIAEAAARRFANEHGLEEPIPF